MSDFGIEDDEMCDFFRLIDTVQGRNLEAVKTLWKKEYIDERDRWNGWTVLHCASANGSGDIVRYLLSEGCHIEDEVTGDVTGPDDRLVYKDRPIHLAAYYGNNEAVTVLIEGQCRLDCVNGDGKTPLVLATETGNLECQRILQEALARKNNIEPVPVKVPTDMDLFQGNDLSDILDPKSGKTMLDKKMLEAIKSKPPSEQEITDWVSLKNRGIDAQSYRLLHECLLYRCIRHEYPRGFEKLCTPDIVNGDKLFMDLSTLETVVDSGVIMFVERVLMRLNKVDDSWTRAEKIATEKGFTVVVSMIADRKKCLSDIERKGYTRLHLAILDKVPDMIDYLLKEGVVESILYNAACDNDDVIFKYMIGATEVTHSGLDNGETLLTSLILDRKKSYIDLVLNASSVSIYTEKRNIHNKLPLHVCIECEYWEIIDDIIANTVSVNLEDNDGNTPLSLLFTKMCETEEETIINRLMRSVKVLINYSVDVFKYNTHGKAAIEYCTKPELRSNIEAFVSFRELRLVATLPPQSTLETSNSASASASATPQM